MSVWAQLHDELEAWDAAGQSACFWWRDDDAVEPTPALERLLALAAERGTPLCLAVVPTAARPELAAALRQSPETAVAVHGYAHVNHAAACERKAEFGPQRPLEPMLAELAEGRARLEALFGNTLRPILVPPWNRIAPPLVPRLPELGFAGLSTYRARAAESPAPGLVQVNTHVDIVAWREGRRFLGAEAALSLAVEHLAAKRGGGADAAEPTGLLTHHLVHDEHAWDFVAAFVEATQQHAATRWLSAAAAFSL